MPYSVACGIEEFREGRSPVYIRAVIYVERDSQKRIIIGSRGSRIREDRPGAAKEDRNFHRRDGIPRSLGQGRSQLAAQRVRPRAFRLSHRKGQERMSLDPQLLEILVCPKCKGELEYREAESSLVCHGLLAALSDPRRHSHHADR